MKQEALARTSLHLRCSLEKAELWVCRQLEA
jgi:hypothetical protein